MIAEHEVWWAPSRSQYGGEKAWLGANETSNISASLSNPRPSSTAGSYGIIMSLIKQSSPPTFLAPPPRVSYRASIIRGFLASFSSRWSRKCAFSLVFSCIVINHWGEIERRFKFLKKERRNSELNLTEIRLFFKYLHEFFVERLERIIFMEYCRIDFRISYNLCNKI